jgi:hypothetical protein
MKARAQAIAIDVPRLMLIALSMTMLMLMAPGCQDDAGDGSRSDGVGFCCDCTCSDGAGPCVNEIVSGAGAESCANICEDACSAEATCNQVEEASVCEVANPNDGKGDDACQGALSDSECI